MSEPRPVSPCINVCVLDAQPVCTGCGRTIDEIARWAQMSAAGAVGRGRAARARTRQPGRAVAELRRSATV